MKKNLTKIRVCLGFDCTPKVNAIRYDDEVFEGGKVYPVLNGNRSVKTLVSLGQTWLTCDDTSRTPFWNAYAIIDDPSDSRYNDIVKKLFDEAKNAMLVSFKSFETKAGAMNAPENAAELVRNELNPSCSSVNGISFTDFKKEIRNRSLALGTENAMKNGLDKDEWKKFFEDTLTDGIIDILMKGLPVLKKSGENFMFQTAEMKENALKAVSIKVSSDVFARFVETKNK